MKRYKVEQITKALTQVDGTAYGAYHGYGIVVNGSTPRTVMFPSHADAQAMCDELNMLAEAYENSLQEIKDMRQEANDIMGQLNGQIEHLNEIIKEGHER